MTQRDYKQAIEDAIEAVSARVAEYGDYFQYETHTRYWLVDPLLSALGWDATNPGQVYIEYPTPSGLRADYALLHPSTAKPLIIVEAKAITPEEIRLFVTDEDPGDIQEWEQKDVDQLEGYVIDCQMATGYGVLTDGASWGIYDLGKTEEFSGKRVQYFDILFELTEVSVAGLMTLHRQNFM